MKMLALQLRRKPRRSSNFDSGWASFLISKPSRLSFISVDFIAHKYDSENPSGEEQSIYSACVHMVAADARSVSSEGT